MNKKKLTIKETLSLAWRKHQANDLNAAEKLYKEILRIRPEDFQSLFLLGSLFAQKQRFDSAKKLLIKAIEIEPKNLAGLNNLGNVLNELGDASKAIECYQKAIEINPNYADAHNNFGNVLKEQGEQKKAIECYRKAIEINPNYADAYNNLGVILKESGEYKKAVTCYEKALKIQPNKINVYNNLGIIFQEYGEMEKAINCYKQLSQIQPNSAYAHQNLGRLYIVLGDFKKAIVSYSEALKFDPDNLVYYYHLVNLKKEILNPDLKEKIEKILVSENCTKKNKAYGNFLLSKFELINKNCEQELHYLLKGHQLFLESKETKINKQIEFWLKELPEQKELINFNIDKKNIKKSPYQIQPIFIVGVPRCGSTLVEKIITSGKKSIPAGEEVGIIGTFIKKMMVKKQFLNSGIEEFQIKLSKIYKEKNLIKKESDYAFTDKTLDNFFYIAFIREIFPNAKIINCKRNALSSIMSILQNNLPAVPWAHNLDHIFQYFDIYYNQINKFKKKFPNFIYELELDNLINNPVKESQSLMNFCGLKWDKKCLEFYKRKDLLSKTTSNVQIRKAINKDSVNKYLPYKQLLIKYGEKYNWFSQ